MAAFKPKLHKRDANLKEVSHSRCNIEKRRLKLANYKSSEKQKNTPTFTVIKMKELWRLWSLTLNAGDDLKLGNSRKDEVRVQIHNS